VAEIEKLRQIYQDLFGGRKIYTYAFICFQCCIRTKCFKTLLSGPTERRQFFRGLDRPTDMVGTLVLVETSLFTVWRLYQFIKRIEEFERMGKTISVAESVVVVFIIMSDSIFENSKPHWKRSIN
jgi:hypothetical protein